MVVNNADIFTHDDDDGGDDVSPWLQNRFSGAAAIITLMFIIITPSLDFIFNVIRS